MGYGGHPQGSCTARCMTGTEGALAGTRRPAGGGDTERDSGTRSPGGKSRLHGLSVSGCTTPLLPPPAEATAAVPTSSGKMHRHSLGYFEPVFPKEIGSEAGACVGSPWNGTQRALCCRLLHRRLAAVIVVRFRGEGGRCRWTRGVQAEGSTRRPAAETTRGSRQFRGNPGAWPREPPGRVSSRGGPLRSKHTRRFPSP